MAGERADATAVAEEIESVPGVLAHGLGVGLATCAVVAAPGATAPRVLFPFADAAKSS